MQSGYCLLPAQPNKLCDIIAAGIVDEYLKRDPETRVRLSVSGGHGALFISGELQSEADYDVAGYVKRILGKYGIADGLEPFISLEKIPSERIMQARQACVDPVFAFGYATIETESQIPKAQHLANQIASALEEKHKADPEWFWMSRIGAVNVICSQNQDQVFIRLDHGAQDLGTVRQEITKLIESLIPGNSTKLVVNALGATEANGLKTSLGQSGLICHPYGTALPSTPNSAGLDWHNAKTIAPIIARHVAKQTLKASGAKAVMVRFLYLPGEDLPAQVWIRDESGRDLSAYSQKIELHLQKAMDNWKQSDLMWRITLNNLIGESNLPWETV
jgi:S-adenosylmethionine synthetase